MKLPDNQQHASVIVAANITTLFLFLVPTDMFFSQVCYVGVNDVSEELQKSPRVDYLSLQAWWWHSGTHPSSSVGKAQPLLAVNSLTNMAM